MAITEPRAPELAPEPHGHWLIQWLTTTDHKRIGILYLLNSFAFFFVAGVFALLMRSELAAPGRQLVTINGYNQLFTLHGTLMIFLLILPVLVGFGNYLVPLQIGALDMAFPRINALSFWLLPVGGLTILSGLLAKGGAAAAGWTSYAPVSEQGGAGQDLWIVGLIVVGTASILSGINFIVTILRLRAPGMTMTRLPVFVWSMLATSLLMVLATPVLTAGLIMLFADRRLGAYFFNPAHGGDVLLWQHVFWFFGHPEVYMLILGAWGVVSEILPVFSGRPLFGYPGVILAFVLITALSFSVWAHHMFVTGQVEFPFSAPPLSSSRSRPGCCSSTGWRPCGGVGSASSRRCCSRSASSRCFWSAGSTACGWRRRRWTSPSTTPTGWSPTSTTCCSAARCSGSWPPATTGSRRSLDASCRAGSASGTSG